jgi:hypothetical protein
MPAISHLVRLGGTFACAAAILWGTVSANQLNTRVSPQPGGQRFSSSVKQQVNRLMTFQIHQDCAILLTSSQRPIIDP